MKKTVANNKNLSYNEHVFLKRLLFTLSIILIYMIGRHIPLYGVDVSQYQTVETDAQSYFLQILSGDFNNYSIFILGLWPYMFASIIAIVYQAIRNADKNALVSPKEVTNITTIFTVIIGLIQGYQRINSLYFKLSPYLYLDKAIAFIEMIAGMLVVMYLCERNQKYGIGNRMAVFLVNIVSGISGMLTGQTWQSLWLPLVLGLVGIPLMLILETTEKRIPVQRVSIHNIYADKNYIAIKLNPAGIMPVMFASAVFMLPQLIANLLAQFFPENATISYISQNMTMTSPLGIIVYLVIICILTVSFAFIMLSPKNLAESLLKSGDSILDVYAGKATKRYLISCVWHFSVFSSIILCVYFGIPFYLEMKGLLNQSVVMLPSSIMMATGLWISLYREAKVYINIDHYKPFV